LLGSTEECKKKVSIGTARTWPGFKPGTYQTKLDTLPLCHLALCIPSTFKTGVRSMIYFIYIMYFFAHLNPGRRNLCLEIIKNKILQQSS